MKKNNKGFLLVETLVVSTFCLTVLIVLFLQFRTLIIHYNDSFKYNTVEGIYNLGVMKDYLEKNNISIDVSASPYFVNLKSSDKCNDFCKKIIEAQEAKTIIYTKSNIENTIKNESSFSEGLKKFISQLKNNPSNNKRLIAEFNDGTYASITY